METSSAIKKMVENGKVLFGTRESAAEVKAGKAKLLVLASNCPRNARRDLEHYAKVSEIPVLNYAGTSIQLGELCGRPHLVASIAVLDTAGLGVAQLLKEVKS